MAGSRPKDSESTTGRLWWRDGVVYQIYPRSFQDSSGDGIGDLEGIRRRLDHLEWLGVDAIWLSPCFPSPMADFGYDVSDYCDIDPMFGSLDDFDRLLADAHGRGIRILLDWVPCHTSDQHPWFQEARKDKESDKRDWFFFRDAKPDGSLPNNWLSIFGGPAWEWDEEAGQYYLHSFLKEQPDLNWRSPGLVSAMHGVLRFWLDRGVDGFRIDVIHRLLKHPELRDLPVIPGREGHGYGGLEHVHDENHPDVHASLRDLRKVIDEYDERMTVGEVYVTDPNITKDYYGKGDELNLAFNFALVHAPFDAARIGDEIARFDALVPAEGWPDIVLSSHDAPRHASRFDHPRFGDDRARLAAMLLLTARGTPFLYYGEEIGMRQIPIPEDRLQDPLAWTLHPNASRDGSRTPMQWEPVAGGGFSEGDPWLPMGDSERRCVADQREDPASLLWLYKNLLTLRRASPALMSGSFRRLEAPEGVFAFERLHPEQRAVVALNFGEDPITLDLGGGAPIGGLTTTYGAFLPPDLSSVELTEASGLVALTGASSGA
ncbi:MAG: alpha-amylase family glycosyl hydrolase [Myxococcota bacterium]|nr:alpha-amylase family glycosyl hydrolase [Myxococcota bacterium]